MPSPAATKPSPPVAAAVPAPRVPSPEPPSRAPFAAKPAAQQARGPTDGGWGSEPEWLREAALAAAAEAAVPSGKPGTKAGGGTKLPHLFSRDRSAVDSSDGSGGAPPKRQARKVAASPQRQRGSGANDKPLRAPAFGESALTKWH